MEDVHVRLFVLVCACIGLKILPARVRGAPWRHDESLTRTRKACESAVKSYKFGAFYASNYNRLQFPSRAPLRALGHARALGKGANDTQNLSVNSKRKCPDTRDIYAESRRPGELTPKIYAESDFRKT